MPKSIITPILNAFRKPSSLLQEYVCHHYVKADMVNTSLGTNLKSQEYYKGFQDFFPQAVGLCLHCMSYLLIFQSLLFPRPLHTSNTSSLLWWPILMSSCQ